MNLVVMSVDERIPGRAKRLLIRAGPVCNTLTVAPIRCGAGCSCLVRPDPAPAPEDAADVGRALGLLVLTLDGDRISHITRFAAASALPHFGLPRTIPW